MRLATRRNDLFPRPHVSDAPHRVRPVNIHFLCYFLSFSSPYPQKTLCAHVLLPPHPHKSKPPPPSPCLIVLMISLHYHEWESSLLCYGMLTDMRHGRCCCACAIDGHSSAALAIAAQFLSYGRRRFFFVAGGLGVGPNFCGMKGPLRETRDAQAKKKARGAYTTRLTSLVARVGTARWTARIDTRAQCTMPMRTNQRHKTCREGRRAKKALVGFTAVAVARDTAIFQESTCALFVCVWVAATQAIYWTPRPRVGRPLFASHSAPLGAGRRLRAIGPKSSAAK
jgi:hypothetical protein